MMVWGSLFRSFDYHLCKKKFKKQKHPPPPPKKKLKKIMGSSEENKFKIFWTFNIQQIYRYYYCY